MQTHRTSRWRKYTRPMSMNNEPDWLRSLSTSDLAKLLASHPLLASRLPSRASEKSSKIEASDSDKMAEYQSKKRAKLRDIKIFPPANPARRLDAESDPKNWLDVYFRPIFYESWTEDRIAMLYSIINAAKYGGDQAIAGPRGEGKTSIAVYAALFCMITSLSIFPVIIGKSAEKAKLELKAIKQQLQQNEMFIADYPEIGIPMEKIGAWSSRARMQTVAGRYTNIELAADHIAFPVIHRDQVEDWPSEIALASRGQVIYSLGIDGPIRGTRFKAMRPTLAVIDDIEDRKSAESEPLIEKNEEIIEKDVAGLGASSERIPRVMLCTVQNRKCNAFRFTDPKAKPSWRGKRYRKMIKRPDRMDLVEQYIEMRKNRRQDDPDAREAFRFWRDNQEILEDGCVVSNRFSFSKKLHSDGEPLELSAIHAYFNRVADVGEAAVATEIDNDPPEESGPQGNGLRPDIVQSRISGLARRQIPLNTVALTAAIDLGKYRCHWVVTAWSHGFGGVVADYGVAEVVNTDRSMTNEASEGAIYQALLNWRDELLGKEFIDTAGNKIPVQFAMVDSGTFTNAAYQFVRDVGGIFHPSKGLNPYYRKKDSTSTLIAGENLHAQKIPASKVWLYELDTNYWKQFVHERFLTPTFDDNNMLRKGSLSIFQDEAVSHISYSQHIAAEELLTVFKEGKGLKTYWHSKSENNHWLDATYMAAAAGEACGVKLVGPSQVELQPRKVEQGEQRRTGNSYRHGTRFRNFRGGSR